MAVNQHIVHTVVLSHCRYRAVRSSSCLIAFLVLAGFPFGTLQAVPQSAEAEYIAQYADTAPLVDGDLSDPAWKKAPAAELTNNLDGSAAGLVTRARVLWNDDFLFFAFECEDPEPFATLDRRDQHLWLEEVVEVFLQPVSNPPHYIELEVNPLATLLDIYLYDVRKPLRYESWNSFGIQWAVNLVDSVAEGGPGWTCEIAFPLADAVTATNLPPRSGDRWRMNLYRIEQKPQQASLAWSPTKRPDFHVPEAFGWLVFARE